MESRDQAMLDNGPSLLTKHTYSINTHRFLNKTSRGPHILNYPYQGQGQHTDYPDPGTPATSSSGLTRADPPAGRSRQCRQTRPLQSDTSQVPFLHRTRMETYLKPNLALAANSLKYPNVNSVFRRSLNTDLPGIFKCNPPSFTAR